MNVLLINKFFYLRGGSETVFFDTASLLRHAGHSVSYFSMDHPKNLDSRYSRYFVSHVDFADMKGFIDRVGSAGRILYSFESQRKLEQLIREERPDIAHLHNIHHQISPSILHTLRKFNIPIVMTLHDYKLVCPIYTLLSGWETCERCRGGRYYHCFFRRCSKQSYLGSALTTAEMYLHRMVLRSFDNVDIFLSPSQFLKNKLAELGFRGTISHLPNSVDTSSYTPSHSWTEDSILYFGRLSREKGLFTLLDAVADLPITCKIIGDGPMRAALEKMVIDRGLQNVYLLGYKPHDELKSEILKSMFVIVPSQWYENNPMTIVEAFACGKPVVGSRIGGIPELVENGRTGLTFSPGNKEELRNRVLTLLNDSGKISEYGRNARDYVERKLNRELYLKRLLETYERAMEKHA